MRIPYVIDNQTHTMAGVLRLYHELTDCDRLRGSNNRCRGVLGYVGQGQFPPETELDLLGAVTSGQDFSGE